MSRDRQPDDPGVQPEEREEASPGSARRSPAERRYPAVPAGTALAKAAERAPAGQSPTVNDVATAAVESKGGGSALPGAVQGPVEAQLGVDLSGVRVHGDDGTRQATAAMGARAFAHGADVFLGPGESAGDLGLMAHELTHVAQQGAAQEKAVQRQVTVGPSDSPAERQADAVAGAVTGGAAPTQMIIDSGEPQSGQMLKGPFMTALRDRVTAAAAEELGPVWSVAGCPYIEAFFARHQNSDARTVETMARRYSGLQTPHAATEYIAPICNRVREGARRWRAGEDVSGDLAAAGMSGTVPPAPGRDASGAATGTAGTAARKPAEPLAASTPESLAAQLGPGQPLDAGTASRMGGAFGQDFSGVRVHTGTEAAQRASAEGAAAFAIGDQVVFGEGQYRPGTPVGDAMLAHELAHTVQQRGAGSDGTAQRQPIGSESAAHEDDADQATAGVMSRLYGRGASAVRGVAERAGPVLTSGYQLQRCDQHAMATGTDVMPGVADNGSFEGSEIGHFEQREVQGGIGGTDLETVITEERVIATETLGFYDREDAAIAMASSAGRTGGGVALEAGRYIAYRASFVPSDRPRTAGEVISTITRGPVMCTSGVVALVSHEGQLLRPGATVTTGPGTHPTAGVNPEPGADTFAGYRAAFGGPSGDMNTVDRERLLLAFQAAMRDNAMAVLARSEERLTRQQEQYATGPESGGGRVSQQELETIRGTASELGDIHFEGATLKQRIEQIRDERDPITSQLPEGGQARIEEMTERLNELVQLRRVQVVRYPLLARYRSAAELREIAGLGDTELLGRIGGQIPEFLESIQDTRQNILTGSLNLWKIDPLTDSTIAGLGITDPQRRGWITAEKEARASRAFWSDMVMLLFEVGFGIAAAFVGGPVGVAFAAGALGLGVADAIRQTDEIFAEQDAANTDPDPGEAMMDPEQARGYGWLVLAWVGVGFDAADVANAVGRVASRTVPIADAARELATRRGLSGAALEEMVQRLRSAAGDLPPDTVVTQEMLRGLSARIGADLQIDASITATRHVQVDLVRDDTLGIIRLRGARCAADATLIDILAHEEVVRLVRRYEGVTGRLRQLWDRARSIVGGDTDEALRLAGFAVDSRGFTSFIELRKYRLLIAERLDRLGTGGLSQAQEAALRADVEFFETEARIHEEVLEHAATEAGPNFIARLGDTTRDAYRRGYRLPGLENETAESLTDDMLRTADYYFRPAGNDFTLVAKSTRDVVPHRAVLATGDDGVVRCTFEEAADRLSRAELASRLVDSWGTEEAAAFRAYAAAQAAAGKTVVPIRGMSASEMPFRALVEALGPENFATRFSDILVESKLRRALADAAAEAGAPLSDEAAEAIRSSSRPIFAAEAATALEQMLTRHVTLVEGTQQLRAFGYRSHFRAEGGRLIPGEDIHHILPLYFGGSHEFENLISLQQDLHRNMHRLFEEISFDDARALISGDGAAAVVLERAAAVIDDATGAIRMVSVADIVAEARRAAAAAVGTPP